MVRSADHGAHAIARSTVVGVTAPIAQVAEPVLVPALGSVEIAPAAFVKGIDDAVAAALADNKLPGCVVTIGRHDRVVFQKAYGMRQVDPERQPMTIDTVFD